MFYIEFQCNGHWKSVQLHPKLIPCKSKVYPHFDDDRISCVKST